MRWQGYQFSAAKRFTNLESTMRWQIIKKAQSSAISVYRDYEEKLAQCHILFYHELARKFVRCWSACGGVTQVRKLTRCSSTYGGAIKLTGGNNCHNFVTRCNDRAPMEALYKLTVDMNCGKIGYQYNARAPTMTLFKKKVGTICCSANKHFINW